MREVLPLTNLIHHVPHLQISEVKEFVLRVNHELRQEEERQKMELTISRLDAYEAVSVPSGCDELAKVCCSLFEM